jgi:hypothetical protein
MKSTVWIIILVVVLMAGIGIYFSGSSDTRYNSECIEGINAFDNKAQSGEIIAQITGLTRQVVGGNYGSGEYFIVSLRGLERVENITVTRNYVSGGFVKAGGARFDTAEQSKEHLVSEVAGYENEGCQCTEDLDELSYSCVCVGFTYSEKFEEGTEVDNFQFVSSKKTSLNIPLYESDVGRFLRVNRIDGRFIPIEVMDCE